MLHNLLHVASAVGTTFTNPKTDNTGVRITCISAQYSVASNLVTVLDEEVVLGNGSLGL